MMLAEWLAKILPEGMANTPVVEVWLYVGGATFIAVYLFVVVVRLLYMLTRTEQQLLQSTAKSGDERPTESPDISETHQ